MHRLNYAIMLSKEQSLIKAAEKLYLTPSALSQYITKEEERLGIQLFTRSREKWLPTYAGQIYIETSRTMLEMQENMERKLSDIANCKTGKFTVGLTPSRGVSMFTEVFPVFHKDYPYVHVHLIEANWSRLQQLLLENAIDIAFTCSCDPGREILPGLASEVLAEEDFVLFVPRIHPVVKCGRYALTDSPATVSLSLFHCDPFIGFSKETTLYPVMEKFFHSAGIAPEILFESGSTTTVQNLALSGFGLAILPKFFAQESEQAVYFNISPSLSWNILAVWRKSYEKTKAVERFIQLAKEYFLSPV